MFFYSIFLPKFFFLRLWILVKRSGWRSLWLSIESFFEGVTSRKDYAILRWASNLAILRNCEEMRKRESAVKKNILSSASQKASKWLFSTDQNRRINFNFKSISWFLDFLNWFWKKLIPKFSKISHWKIDFGKQIFSTFFSQWIHFYDIVAANFEAFNYSLVEASFGSKSLWICALKVTWDRRNFLVGIIPSEIRNKNWL